MNILITGSEGFIGKNLKVRLLESVNMKVFTFDRGTDLDTLDAFLSVSDFVIHLAGENRPKSIEDYMRTNHGLTEILISKIKKIKRIIPIIFTSTTQVNNDTEYGRSKSAAEKSLLKFSSETLNPVYIYRLPNVYGKFSKPNYNSVVSTFCVNEINGVPSSIIEPNKTISLLYIDDLVSQIINQIINGINCSEIIENFNNIHEISIIDLYESVLKVKKIHESNLILNDDSIFLKNLYATYLSFLTPEKLKYFLKENKDLRGKFIEIFKIKNAGQISIFTMFPGVVRGNHYHHTKCEKFLILKGSLLFKFKHIITNQTYEIKADEKNAIVIETAPGWAHSIINFSTEEAIVLVWANEWFNVNDQDTNSYKV
jgi:UDP-2-acetamido-2,6-beta-L-arabino-hexul-4-ose reductase